MEKPWYIEEYEEKDYLHNKELQYKEFIGEDKNDHEHCELCWHRISNLKDDSHNGYYEELSKSWICDECFNDFKDLFGWSVRSEN